MNSDWKAFLSENNAVFNDEELVSFGNPEFKQLNSAQGLLLSNPSDRALIKVTGEDAESFLQNQLTNDIRSVIETHHQASAWCSPKGRIIANFRIFKRSDAYYLALSADLLEHVMKKLRMYVMMSKVTLEDVTDTIVNFSFAGEGADQYLEEITGTEIAPGEALQYKSLSILRYPGSLVRFDIFGEVDDAKSLWLQCKQHAIPVSGMGARYMDIVSGNPEITAANSEAWIPQMVNYIEVGGVDFKKGCYPGQEVVARLNYLGKTKRRMYHIQIDTDVLPEVGTVIKSETEADAGKILNAVINADGKAEALAVLKIAEVNNALALDNDAKITLLDLPYVVND
jgi:hypothetical protein